KEQETESSQLESALEEISQELAQKPAYEAELEQAQTALAQVEKVITEHESRLTKLKKDKEALENKQQQLTQLEEHIAATKRELERRQQEVAQYQARIKEHEELIAQRPAIEEGYARLSEARKQNEELNQKLGLLVKLREGGICFLSYGKVGGFQGEGYLFWPSVMVSGGIWGRVICFGRRLW
ncbi:unnamed protein product, partial [marine sediment metagenome]